MYADAENINQLFIYKGYYASDHLNVFLYIKTILKTSLMVYIKIWKYLQT